MDPGKFNFKNDRLYEVVDILDEQCILLDTGLKVKFLGVDVIKKEEALEYLKKYLLKKKVFLKFDNDVVQDEDTVEAYVYLKNKIFINAYLIKSGLAKALFIGSENCELINIKTLVPIKKIKIIIILVTIKVIIKNN